MEVIEAINEARLSRFHAKAIFVSGMGFFTDAYDLFIIGVASTLLAKQWHLSATQTGLINSMTSLLGAFLGACVLGRLADVLGLQPIAVFDAAVMVVFALASALAPSFIFLVGFRFLLGFGVGGDYPVSAVLMSQYAIHQDGGRLVDLVLAMPSPSDHRRTDLAAGLVLLWPGFGRPSVRSASVGCPRRWCFWPGCGCRSRRAVFCPGQGRRPRRRRRRGWLLGRVEVVATGTARAASGSSTRQF